MGVLGNIIDILLDVTFSAQIQLNASNSIYIENGMGHDSLLKATLQIYIS